MSAKAKGSLTARHTGRAGTKVGVSDPVVPCGRAGSLRPTFVPARDVSLAVKLPYAFTLYGWFPISLREPSRASVTFWEATAPVKLPTRHCPGSGSRTAVRVRPQISKGWYFNNDSTTPSDAISQSPTYPTHHLSKVNTKL